MALVIVERQFEALRTFEDIAAQEAAASWCLSTHNVRYLRSYFSRDRRHMICFYDAPDAEAVRATQRTAQLPVSFVYSVDTIVERSAELRDRYSIVVAQRDLEQRFTRDEIVHAASDPMGCHERQRLTHVGAYMSVDRSRMVCIFYGPDAEAVRASDRQAGVPLERAWVADAFHAEASPQS